MKLYDLSVQYAKDVIDGIEITTWEVKRQCEIFFEDMEKQKEESYPYYFDMDALERIESLLWLFRLATGANDDIVGALFMDCIAPFQAFLITNVFAWRFKNRPKKFKNRFICLYMARKNAKTAIVGIIFILLMLTEQDYSEYYSICLNKELAGEIRKSMVQIIKSSPDLEPFFKISDSFLGELKCLITNSFFQPRVAEAGKNNSIRPAGVVCDEMGNMSDGSNFNAMKSGQKNVPNPLTFITTTAYEIDDSIMLDELDYMRKVLRGHATNERMFSLIYYADDEHLWDDYGIYQANPLRIEENYETMREDRERALEQENLQGEYLAKTMNVFQPAQGGETYVTYDDIKPCEFTPEELEEFSWEGREVYVGIDMALTSDNVGVTMVAYDYRTDMFYAEPMCFIPRLSVDAKTRKERLDYRAMIRNGYCIACGDRIIGYDTVEGYVLSLEEKYGVTIKCIAYDKMNATHSINFFDSCGYSTIEIEQKAMTLHPATKKLRENIYRRKFKYKSNSLYVENFIHACLRQDSMLNSYIHKKNSGKVDMVASTINAIVLWMDDIENPNALASQGGIMFM